jgi:hypothetical protein
VSFLDKEAVPESDGREPAPVASTT